LDDIGVSAACSQDRMHIEKLEGELRNCYQEIGLQVQKEQQKSITALGHLQEVNKLAKKQSMEIRRLKTALEVYF
ncbi:hypothetical protein BHE74_00003709, partial [Ensete ventricosum]